MTLMEVQDTILEAAWWLDEGTEILVTHDLRRDLHLNDEELLRMFGTTDVRTVGDCIMSGTGTKVLYDSRANS